MADGNLSINRDLQMYNIERKTYDSEISVYETLFNDNLGGIYFYINPNAFSRVPLTLRNKLQAHLLAEKNRNSNYTLEISNHMDFTLVFWHMVINDEDNNLKDTIEHIFNTFFLDTLALYFGNPELLALKLTTQQINTIKSEVISDQVIND